MRKLFHLFDASGFYTEDYYAQECPRTPGTYIVNPDFSTDLPIPILAVNEWAQFVSGAWIAVPNHRGETWYDQTTGAPVTIEAFGQPAANLAATLPLTIALEQKRTAQIAVLQASYAAAISTPVTFKNAAGISTSYPAGNTVAINGFTAMQNLSNAIGAGSSAWTLGKWLDVNNMTQAFTYVDLQGLAAAMESVISLDWQDLIAKVGEVHAATSIADIESVAF